MLSEDKQTSFWLVTVTKLAEKYRAAERYNDFVPSAIFPKQHKHQSHNLVSSSCVTVTKRKKKHLREPVNYS